MASRRNFVITVSPGVLAAGALALHILATPVSADSRTPPQATQHALEELQNAIAQGRITLTSTPTPTPTPTWTPSPTSTPTPEPTDEPTASPTPVPCWQTDDDGQVVFDEDGAPVPCVLALAQVLPVGGPPDDGLAIDPNAAAVVEAPPPADPNNPGAQPSPIVIVIIATAAPVPTLPPEIVYVSQLPAAAVPTPSAAQVIYLVVTPTPQGAAIAEPTPRGAMLPTIAPTDAPVSTPATAPAEDEPPFPAADPEPVSDLPSQPGTATGDPPSSHAPAPPMLASFGLWAGMRRRVQEETPPWLPVLSSA